MNGRRNVGELHIISHGDSGTLMLSGNAVDEQSLQKNAGLISKWSDALTKEADILIYGCNVASTDVGKSFAEALAKLTGADVAASIDRTGNAAQDADWILEYNVGTIESAVALNLNRLKDFETTYQPLFYQTNQALNPEQITVRFLNDVYNPAENYDRNATIESIDIDGVFYETEDGNVRSTGSYRPEDGILPGFGRGEILHANGQFEYGTDQPRGGSRLEVIARGETGGEQFDVFAGNVWVSRYNAGIEFQSCVFETTSPIDASDIRIRFVNDVYEPGVHDNNLIVDHIKTDGQVFETEADNVYSTGTWKPEDGITPGFRNSEYLHANGYFQFGSAVSSDGFGPDESFGDGGVVELSDVTRPVSGSVNYAVETLDGGTIVGVGDQLRKYDGNGNLDASYGANGVVNLPTGDRPEIEGLERLSDGSVIALGVNDIVSTVVNPRPDDPLFLYRVDTSPQSSED